MSSSDESPRFAPYSKRKRKVKWPKGDSSDTSAGSEEDVLSTLCQRPKLSKYGSMSHYEDVSSEPHFVLGGIMTSTDDHRYKMNCATKSSKLLGRLSDSQKCGTPENHLPSGKQGVVFDYLTSSYSDGSGQDDFFEPPNSQCHGNASKKCQPRLLENDYSLSSSIHDSSDTEDENGSETEETASYHFNREAQERKKVIERATQQQSKSQKNNSHHHSKELAQESMLRIYGKGFKLLKQMGYEGGGLGKAGTGIVTPLTSRVRQKNEGLREYKQISTHPDDDINDDERTLEDIDLLGFRHHGTHRKEHKSRDERAKKKKPSKHIKTRFQYKTAAEIAVEAKRYYTKLLCNEYRQTETVHMDHGDDVSLNDIKSIGQSKHQRELQKCRQHLYEVHQHTEENDYNVGFRVVDMTGPTERVIEDVSEFRLLMSDSFNSTSRNDAYTTSGISPLRQTPIEQFSCYAEKHTQSLEKRIQQLARNRVIQEHKLQNAAATEDRCLKRIEVLKQNQTAIADILHNVMVLRQSKEMNYIKQHCSTLMEEDEHEPDQSIGGGSTTEEYRQAAVSKYQPDYSSLTAPPLEVSSSLKTELNDAHQGEAKNESTIIQDDELSLELSSMSTDAHPIDIDPACLVKQFTDVFRQLRDKWPSEYNTLKLSLLATEMVGVTYEYLTFILHNGSRFNESKDFYMASVLVQFRHACILPKLTQLRAYWESVISDTVVQALSISLADFQVNPAQQDLHQLQRLFDWVNTLPLEKTVTLLETQLFPKWLEVLRLWLQCPGVDLEEIYVWYNGWKNIFPEVLTNHSVIQAHFMKGLHLINSHLLYLADQQQQQEQQRQQQTYCNLPSFSASREGFQSRTTVDSYNEDTVTEVYNDGNGESVNRSSSTKVQNCSLPSPPPPHFPEDNISDSSDDRTPSPPPPTQEMSKANAGSLYDSQGAKVASSMSRFFSASRLVEVLESLAEEHDIVFIPKHGRLYNGRQIFAFGNLSIYVDAGLIYRFNPSCGSWSCIPVSSLLELVRPST